jgi:hypothetical protein
VGDVPPVGVLGEHAAVRRQRSGQFLEAAAGPRRDLGVVAAPADQGRAGPQPWSREDGFALDLGVAGEERARPRVLGQAEVDQVAEII